MEGGVALFRLFFFWGGGGTTRRAAQERAADEKFLQACAQYLISSPELQFLQSKQRYLDPTGPLGVPDSRSEDTGSAGRDGEGAVGGARRRVIKLTFSARGATTWRQERLPGPFCSKNTSDSRIARIRVANALHPGFGPRGGDSHDGIWRVGWEGGRAATRPQAAKACFSENPSPQLQPGFPSTLEHPGTA